MHQHQIVLLLLACAVVIPFADAGLEGAFAGLHVRDSALGDDSDIHMDIGEDDLMQAVSPSAIVPQDVVSQENDSLVQRLKGEDDSGPALSAHDRMSKSVKDLMGDILPPEKKTVKAKKVAKTKAPTVQPESIKSAPNAVSSGELLLRLAEASLNHEQIGAKPKRVAKKHLKKHLKPVKKFTKIKATVPGKLTPKASKLEKQQRLLFKPTMLLSRATNNEAHQEAASAPSNKAGSMDRFEMDHLMEEAMKTAAAHSHRVYKAKVQAKLSMEEQLNRELDEEVHKKQHRRERRRLRVAKERRAKKAQLQKETAVFNEIHTVALPVAKVHVLQHALEEKQALEARQLTAKKVAAAKQALAQFKAAQLAAKRALAAKRLLAKQAAEAAAQARAIQQKRFAARQVAKAKSMEAQRLAKKAQAQEARKAQKAHAAEAVAVMQDLKEAATATPVVHTTAARKTVKKVKNEASPSHDLAQVEDEALSEVRNLKQAAKGF